MVEANKILQAVLIVLIISSLSVGYFFFRDIYKTYASREGQQVDECTPFDVKILNLSSTHANVEWQTSESCFSYAKLTIAPGDFDESLTIPSTLPSGKVHQVQINGLNPGSEYFLYFSSNGTYYDINGIPFKFETEEAI